MTTEGALIMAGLVLFAAWLCRWAWREAQKPPKDPPDSTWDLFP
jgi:hypothetical protein